MNLNTQDIVDLLLKYKYLILFPIAFLEGPLIAVVCGYLIAIKQMVFLPAYLVLISANIIGDIVYYLMGRLIPRKKLEKFFKYFHITSEKVEKVEKVFLRNRKMAITFGKIAHAIGSVFLITAGIVKVPIREYLSLGTAIEFPKALIFILMGFWFGKSVENLNQVADYSMIGFILFTGLIAVVYYFVGKATDDKIDRVLDKK